jgi:cbb3-type cytochrome oxidase maturation protein
MNILLFLIPLALLIAGAAAAAFIWSVRSGQLDDLDTPPLRLLTEDRGRSLYNEGAVRHE